MKNNLNKNVLQTINVSDESELLPFLLEKKIRKSRNAIKSLLTHKQIKVNNQIISKHNHIVKNGDIITIHKYDNKHNVKKLKGLSIIYEDRDIIVVDKEAGLLSISTGVQLKETAFNIVNNYLKEKNANARAYVLFRLDRESSGLMIYAKSTEIQENLQKRWILNPPTRNYVAIVEGEVEAKKDTIISWLTENKNFQMFASNFDNGGQKAILNYEVIQKNHRISLLSIELITARKNQIRVQLQSIGHSIVGDKKYGSKINSLKRVALHANKITFKHPTTDQVLTFESDMPKKMQIFADTILAKKDNSI